MSANEHSRKPWHRRTKAETRARILALLERGERSLREIVQRLGRSRTVVSFHLMALHEDGVLSRRCEGTSPIYALRRRNGVRAGRDRTIYFQEAMKRPRSREQRAARRPRT